jgi:hypothetical protein
MQRQAYCVAKLHSIWTIRTKSSPAHLASLGRCQFLQEAHPLLVSSQVCTRPICFFAVEYRSITESENIDIGSPSAIATIRHIEVVHRNVLEGLLSILEI